MIKRICKNCKRSPVVRGFTVCWPCGVMAELEIETGKKTPREIYAVLIASRKRAAKVDALGALTLDLTQDYRR